MTLAREWHQMKDRSQRGHGRLLRADPTYAAELPEVRRDGNPDELAAILLRQMDEAVGSDCKRSALR